MFTIPAVKRGEKILATLPASFKRDKKRASSVVAECRFGRCGTLQTVCKGKSPAESGTSVSTSDASFDTETGSSDLNKRGPGRPERDRPESFTNIIFLTVLAEFLAIILVVGSMILWGPTALYLIVSGDPVAGLLLLGYGVVIVGAVDNILRPMVGPQQSGLGPATFIVGVFAGVSVLGFIGLFFGPVVLAKTKNVLDVIEIDIEGLAID